MNSSTKQSRSAPQLRFPEFNREWEKKKLGEVAEIKTGGKDTQNRSENGLYPFFVRSNTVERINSYSFDGEAILTSGDGVGVGKNFHYINGKFDFHQRVYSIRNFKEGINGKYVYNIFSEKFYDRVIRLSAKNSVDSVRMDMIADMEISFPTLPEQTKIASFLTALDQKIQSLKKKKSGLENYKKGVMQKLFSQELRFKDENGKAFPVWEEKKLGEVCEINSSNKKMPDTFIYIDLESVVKGNLIKENEISREGAPSRAQRVLKEKDILFQMVRPYQMNNLYFNKVGNYVASTGYALLRTIQNSMYIYHYLHLQNFVDNVIERCTGTSYPSINSSDLANVEIELPCIQEQSAIANFLTAIDEKINNTNTQITQMETWKKGLLQKMFV